MATVRALAAPMAASSAHFKQPKRQIFVQAEGDDLLRLTRTAQQLNYNVCRSQIAGNASSWNSIPPVAAIVSDSGASSLSACLELSKSCPVILVSDRSDLDFRLAAVRAGVSGIIRRPISPAELSGWLSLFVSRLEDTAISVLIVDDDALASRLNAEILESAGMNVEITSDPGEALRAIEEYLPDIVLMDLRMPAIDGLEIVQMVRQSMRFAALPILFLSAVSDEKRQLVARQYGGDDFILKPVMPDRLIAVVKLRAERSIHLRSLIERDGLTGVLNHTRFTERLTHEVERCCRSGAEVSLAMIDVDHFKGVNDEHGHTTGDGVLRSLTDLLTAGLRGTDIVGRCGGEEFGVILLDTGPEAAVEVMDSLRHRFGSMNFAGRLNSFGVTFSAGIASSKNHRHIEDLRDAADAALYVAKRGGRNCVCVDEVRK